MKRVAVLIDAWFPFVGGGQVNAYEISKRLVKNGYQIDIITRNNSRDKKRYPKGIKIIRLGKKSKNLDLINRLTYLISAYRYVANGNYDLVHAHAFLPGIPAYLVGKIRKKPSIFTVHGTSLKSGFNNPLVGWVEKLVILKLKYTGEITVSRDVLFMNNVNSKVSYIPNGVNINIFQKNKMKRSKTPRILFVGRLHSQKNLTNLIKSVAAIIKLYPECKVVIVGKGNEEKHLKDLSKALNLDNHIVFMGELQGQSLINEYKAASILVLPSIYEGQPLVVLEAWASKTPVVASKTGDLAFLIKDGKNGYFINDPKAPAQISKAVLKALENKNLQKLGINGYNLVKSQFSWETAALKTLQTYKSILNG